MSDTWYYTQNGTQAGPISRDALRGMVRAGQVGAGELVWTEGMAQWQPASAAGLLDGGDGAGAYRVSPATGPAMSPQAGAGPIGYYGASPDEPIYAGFFSRFAAAVVDGIVLLVVALVTGGVIGVAAATAGARGGTPGGTAVTALVQIVNLGVNWMYFAGMESSQKQATLGKLAVGIRVTDEAGNRIGFGRATGRFFGKYLSALILFIGYLMQPFTARKQALHDLLAHTLVVKTPQ